MYMIYDIKFLNLQSVELLKSLYLELESRGMYITDLSLRVFNDKRRFNVFRQSNQYSAFKSHTDRFLNENDAHGYNIVKLEYFNLNNNNLSRYNNRFYVDCNDLNRIQFKEYKLSNPRLQHVINREVERYKRLLQGLLQDYIIAYRDNLLLIIEEQNALDSVKNENYVDVDYMSDDYVTPQQ